MTASLPTKDSSTDRKRQRAVGPHADLPQSNRCRLFRRGNVPGTTRSTPTSLDCLAQGIVRVRPSVSAPGDLGSY